MKFGEPINPDRPPQTPSEEHFAYLNSEKGEQEFKSVFTESGLLNAFNEETRLQEKELKNKIETFKKTEVEVNTTIGILNELLSKNILYSNTIYLTVLNKLRDISYGPNSDSINANLLKNRAIVADTILTILRQKSIITNETELNQILILLYKYLQDIQNHIRNLQSEL